MTSSLASSKPSRSFRGRPSPTVVAKVASNMDTIAILRDDEAELRRLQAQEVLARRDCRCADRRLHTIDCELGRILARKSVLIQRCQRENAELTGASL